jgi:hypothetical protein
MLSGGSNVSGYKSRLGVKRYSEKLADGTSAEKMSCPGSKPGGARFAEPGTIRVLSALYAS